MSTVHDFSKCFVGVVGVTSALHTTTILRVPQATKAGHRMGVVVKANLATLMGGAQSTPNLYPAAREIPHIFLTGNHNSLNLVEYETPDRCDLVRQFNAAAALGEGNQHGIMVSMRTANPYAISDFRLQHEDSVVVLRVDPEYFRGVNRTPLMLAWYLSREYLGVDHFLLDPTGTDPTDLAQWAPYVKAIKTRIADEHLRNVGVGIMGGLHEGNLNQISALRKGGLWPLSFCAEGRLRNTDDALDLDKTAAFVKNALPIIR